MVSPSTQAMGIQGEKLVPAPVKLPLPRVPSQICPSPPQRCVFPGLQFIWSNLGLRPKVTFWIYLVVFAISFVFVDADD